MNKEVQWKRYENAFKLWKIDLLNQNLNTLYDWLVNQNEREYYYFDKVNLLVDRIMLLESEK